MLMKLTMSDSEIAGYSVDIEQQLCERHSLWKTIFLHVFSALLMGSLFVVVR